MAAETRIPEALSLAGQVVVVTGRLTQLTRAQAEAEIRRLGGTVGNGVTAKTNYLVAGEDAGSKLAKARELGLDAFCEVHNEAELARVKAIGADIIGVNSRDLRTIFSACGTLERSEVCPMSRKPLSDLYHLIY